MIRHGIYHLFVFITYIPLAVLYWAGLAGDRTDDAVYRFRSWCYPAHSRKQFPVFRVGLLATLAIVTIALLTAGVMTILTGGANSVSPSAPAAMVTSAEPIITHDIADVQIPRPTHSITVPKRAIVHHHRKIVIPVVTPKPTISSTTVTATPSPAPTYTHTPAPTPTPSPTPTSSPTPTPQINLTGAARAVAYAADQLGCPYVYGGTGPCHAGYDCSGLVQAAWSYAGVSIPRTSYDQWNQLKHVSLDALQLGDIVVSNGAGHVGLYVGGGYVIDALNSGTPIEKISIRYGWYAASVIGAVRP